MQEYLNVLKNNYANFEGRARRKEYWMFLLFNMIASLLCFIADIGLMMAVGIGGLNLLYMLGVLIPSVAVTVRRLHDTGRSGWWILVGFVPFVGLILLAFMVMDSEPGDNAWGKNPKGIGSVPNQVAATA